MESFLELTATDRVSEQNLKSSHHNQLHFPEVTKEDINQSCLSYLNDTIETVRRTEYIQCQKPSEISRGSHQNTKREILR